MKKILATLAVTMLSPIAFAKTVNCGANIETEKGSNVYNKSVFHEAADMTRTTVRYVLADGSYVRGENLTPEELKKVVNGSIAIGYSFKDDNVSMFAGLVERNQEGHISMKNLAMAGGGVSPSTYLLGNGAALFCAEVK